MSLSCPSTFQLAPRKGVWWLGFIVVTILMEGPGLVLMQKEGNNNSLAEEDFGGFDYFDFESCRPTAENCTFFEDCLEALVPCGNGGFARRFGSYYCQRMMSAEPLFSELGRAWIRRARLCIQSSLLPLVSGMLSLTCGEVREYGLRQASLCLTKVNPGLCSLPPGDGFGALALFQREVRDPRAWPDVTRLVRSCATQFLFG